MGGVSVSPLAFQGPLPADDFVHSGSTLVGMDTSKSTSSAVSDGHVSHNRQGESKICEQHLHQSGEDVRRKTDVQSPTPSSFPVNTNFQRSVSLTPRSLRFSLPNLAKLTEMEERLAGCNLQVSQVEAEAADMAVEGMPQRWSTCWALSNKLETLCADALESGCRRETAGAMDVFEQAIVSLERVARLLSPIACQQRIRVHAHIVTALHSDRSSRSTCDCLVFSACFSFRRLRDALA